MGYSVKSFCPSTQTGCRRTSAPTKPNRGRVKNRPGFPAWRTVKNTVYAYLVARKCGFILAHTSCVFVGVDVHGNPKPKVTSFDGARIFFAVKKGMEL